MEEEAVGRASVALLRGREKKKKKKVARVKEENIGMASAGTRVERLWRYKRRVLNTVYTQTVYARWIGLNSSYDTPRSRRYNYNFML